MQKLHISIDHPKEILSLRRIFSDAGHQLFLVGGCVRDSILGLTPKDWDLATDATPEQMQVFLSEFHIIPVGEAFGVIRILIGEHEFEIATFREDIGEGRRPDSVRFADIKTDVLRRDFTINALFFDIQTSEIVDLIGGFEDLRQKTLRTVGPPSDRFREDRLRKLRAVRFSTRFGLTMDPFLRQSIQLDPSLHEVSPERMRDEFLKSLRSSTDPWSVIRTMADLGLTFEIFGNITFCHFVSICGLNTSAIIAALFRETDLKELETMLRRLTFTSVEIRDILWMVRFHQDRFQTPFQMKRSQRTDDMTIRQFSDITRMNRELTDRFMEWELSVTGEELMAEGFVPGREMGLEIERREDAIFQSSIEKC
jgi:tRNA nucleotidyltransferase/poly(A) polymerase